MRAKLLAVSSVLVLGLAACGDDVDTVETEAIEPPAVDTGVVDEPAPILEDEAEVGAPLVVEPDAPVVAEPGGIGATEPGAAEPMEDQPNVTTFGGGAGPTTESGGGVAEDSVVDDYTTDAETGEETEETPANPGGTGQ